MHALKMRVICVVSWGRYARQTLNESPSGACCFVGVATFDYFFNLPLLNGRGWRWFRVCVICSVVQHGRFGLREKGILNISPFSSASSCCVPSGVLRFGVNVSCQSCLLLSIWLTHSLNLSLLEIFKALRFSAWASWYRSQFLEFPSHPPSNFDLTLTLFTVAGTARRLSFVFGVQDFAACCTSSSRRVQ